MAHHQHGGDSGRNTALQSVINMLRLSTTSNMPSIGEDEATGDTDEPPDHHTLFKRRPTLSSHNSHHVIPPTLDRRESLLTRALMTSPEHSPETTEFPSFPVITPATSTRSIASVPSTAELTSDGGITSPERSNPPSPPSTMHLPLQLKGTAPPPHITVALDSRGPSRTTSSENHEAAVEANLGRKRCISFACGRKATEQKPVESNREEPQPEEPLKRKSMLTFACPLRTKTDLSLKEPARPVAGRLSPAPVVRKLSGPSVDSTALQQRKLSPARRTTDPKDLNKSEKTRFHEFEVSRDENDEWVNEVTEEKPKITVNDCMKKEMAIRRIGEQAEQEAEDEDDEAADNLDDEDDETAGFSDHLTDDGNESDDEGGFAESDDSDAGSDYHFWTLSTTTAATSTDQLDYISSRPNPHRTNSETSLDSINRRQAGHVPIFHGPSAFSRKKTKLPRFRPGTPDLPDSTDFVCGTLDEDRPLEAAYLSCLEERRRAKYVPIPQDIDPSFPTSDPDAVDDEEDDYDDGPATWIKAGMEGIDSSKSAARGRHRSIHHDLKSLSQSPNRLPSPPKRNVVRRSPPPLRRLGSSPKRLRSPPPPKGRSPPLAPNKPVLGLSPPRPGPNLRITGRIYRGCGLTRTNSLPRTPNPFFARQLRMRDDAVDKLDSDSSKTVLPQRRPSGHTRGPIDIVEGLEKKRQKRAEKFWRQHCRKAAKEEAQRKPIPGKGAERMKEIGLEMHERAKGYGLGQPAPLVLSI